jgi:putative DNA primase/helicase
MTSTLLTIARAYWEAGHTPMPRIGEDPNPHYLTASGEVLAILWGQYKIKQPDWSTVATWFAHGDLTTTGMTLLPGSHAHPRADMAAYLQILDVETPEIYTTFVEALHFLGHSALLHRLLIEETPSGGRHLGFLCATISDKPKLKLAVRADHKILIELLQHQPCTIAPTAIRCKPEHPAGATYHVVQRDWAHLLTISQDQRKALLDVAKSLTEVPDRLAPGQTTRAADGTQGPRPGDVLNEQADRDWWDDLLTRHDWRNVSRGGGGSRGITYFQRPGKRDRSISATYGRTGIHLYVFSSNAQPFEPDTAYSPFGAYTLLEHDSDFKAATKALAQRYGMKLPRRTSKPRRVGQTSQLWTETAAAPPCPVPWHQGPPADSSQSPIPWHTAPQEVSSCH